MVKNIIIIYYSNLTVRNSQNLMTTKTMQLKQWASQAPMAHTCNTSYSGGRDQQNCSSNQPRQIVPQDPISKKPSQNNDWWSGSRLKALSLSPSFI
jgi:hypothetical protein